jgi:hypothetical protein
MGRKQKVESGLSKVKIPAALVPPWYRLRDRVPIKQHAMQIAHAFPKRRFAASPIFEKFPF